MLLNKRISVVYFLNMIKVDIVVIVFYAVAAATLIHTTLFKEINIPLAISTVLATLISLLLAFKTSQSYERWWEARVVWGGIVNDSRTLLRLLKQHLPPSPDTSKRLEKFARRQSVWCYSLADSLRKVPYSSQVQAYVDAGQIQTNNLPNFILNQHSGDLALLAKEFDLNVNVQVQFDRFLAQLNESMGRCERIKNTVFPRSYSLLIRTIIYIFLTIFPFGLSHMDIVGEVLLTILIPILFISIERTAIILQDPFENRPTDTPMTQIAQTIERNLEEMLDLPPRQQEITNHGYFSL